MGKKKEMLLATRILVFAVLEFFIYTADCKRSVSTKLVSFFLFLEFTTTIRAPSIFFVFVFVFIPLFLSCVLLLIEKKGNESRFLKFHEF